MLSTWLTDGDGNLDHPAHVVLARFLLYEVTLSPFPCCSLCSSHFRSSNSCSTSLRREFLRKLFGIPFAREIVLFSPFIYLLSHVFISERNHGYLFPTSDFNPKLLFCSNCSIFGHWELFPLAPVSLWHTPISMFWCGDTSFLSGTTLCSRPILNTFCLHARVSSFSKEHWFLDEWY